MPEKKETKTEERIHTIPLVKAWNRARTKRAKKAMTIIKNYIKRHMKADKVHIGKSINEDVWARGMQKPPRKVRIHVLKKDDIAYAELIGVEIKTPSAEEKKKMQEKEKKKQEKIKQERKERKKMTMQEEVEAESGKEKEVEKFDKGLLLPDKKSDE